MRQVECQFVVPFHQSQPRKLESKDALFAQSGRAGKCRGYWTTTASNLNEETQCEVERGLIYEIGEGCKRGGRMIFLVETKAQMGNAKSNWRRMTTLCLGV